jgi:hypothetical protein
MVTVLETKESLGCILFGCQFRDLFIKHYNFFPLFGGFGQKTAESQDLVLAFRLSLSQLKSIELNTSTLLVFQKVNQSKEFDCFL